MKPFKLLAVCPGQTDATSFYRGLGPLMQLSKANEDVDIFMTDKYNWVTMGIADGVFVQRPYKQEFLSLIKMAQRNGKKVWVDFDDDLFDVPASNPTHRTYAKPEVQKIVATCIASADVVSVSTEALARKFDKCREGKSPAVVVPNAFNDYLFKMPVEFTPPKLIVNWRGSETHDKDLWGVTKSLYKLSRLEPAAQWTWSFIGSPFWLTLEHLPHKNTIVAPPVDPIEYFELISKINPALQIVPLHDSPFNRAKSNIGWIEATYAGAATLAPQFEEWFLPGVMNYTSEKHFEERMEAVLSGQADIKSAVEKSRAYINENLLLSKVNAKRYDIIWEYLA